MSSRYVRFLHNSTKNSSALTNFIRNYSRKVGNDSESPYKHVKPKHPLEDACNLVWKDPSFEILTANEFPLFLRGNIGLAWYDTQTTVKSHHELIMEQIDHANDPQNSNITVKVQKCPTLLRGTVKDLFPYRPLEDNSVLSVVTIALKPNIKDMRTNKELETERLAQTFLITAKKICDKLRTAGYWADFINPFSGRPYFTPSTLTELYQTHEKFRCLDFQIVEIKDCKVISNDDDSLKQFVGSLFTSAACNKRNLNSVFM
ncbi:unnamed protein product [Psylliodes chrysocephalus]|uniref:Uncharacterized protein n=1 Tax=Psylliodes chrysocephalus TaxID=3402493 RepID=A0A9P0GKE7_9CUCU|nr:unnamed protein product [Psylliodes chrysocephala]